MEEFPNEERYSLFLAEGGEGILFGNMLKRDLKGREAIYITVSPVCM